MINKSENFGDFLKSVLFLGELMEKYGVYNLLFSTDKKI